MRHPALIAGMLLAPAWAAAQQPPNSNDLPRTSSVNATSPRSDEAAKPRLADAAMRGDSAAVRSLLATRTGINLPQGDGMTALHWAAERGDLAMTEQLLRAGAKTNLKSVNGSYTPLQIASRNGHASVVRALLKAGSDPAAVTAGGATALHLAAESGSAATVSALLDYKADPNARESEWGQTPLMFAAAADRADAIRALLSRKADVSVATRTVDLTDAAAREKVAVKKRNEVLMSMLPQAVQDSVRAARKAAAGAASAARPGAPGAAAAPGGLGAPGASGLVTPAPVRESTEAPPTNTLTSAQIAEAVEAGRLESLKPIVASTQGASAELFEGQVAGYEGTVGAMGGMTALHHAVRQGNYEAAVALLDGGANIDQVTLSDSTSPVLMAALNGQFDLAMELIRRGANVKLMSTAGTTPLYAAVNTMWAPRSRFPQPQAVQNQKTTHIELMDALLKHGADVNVRLKKNLWFFGYNNCGNGNCGLEYLDGTTAFWRASYAVDLEAMKLLKAAGADDTLPSFRVVAARGARGGGAGPVGGATLDSAGRAAVIAARATAGGAAAAGAGGGAGAGAGAGADAASSGGRRQAMAARSGTSDTAGAPAARGAAPGAFSDGAGGPAPAPMDAETDSASKAVPPGIGVYPIHAAAGVGYGNGFAGNSHRHAPEGWMPAMRYLVEVLHADVNKRDVNGYTPLHHAAARGDNEMILYLVSKGADVKAVARNGRTVVDMANGPVQRLSPIPDTIKLLEKLGAKNSHHCVSC